MAKILFISVNDINAEGVRVMSSKLRQAGHQPHIIFLKRLKNGENEIENYDWVGINEKGREFRYTRGSEITIEEKRILTSHIRDIMPDLIGFSVVTPLKKRITEVTRLIKEKFNIPVVWGGPDPTVNPLGCLQCCDIVNIGEGESSIVDIADSIDKNRDIREVKNLAYMERGRLVRNKLYPLITNLDELPFKDVSPDNKYLIDNDVLIRDFGEVSCYLKERAYNMISSRGCPYSCSYCCESFYKRLYSPQIFLRRRSPLNVIEELKKAKKLLDCKLVIFEDEIFSLDETWLEAFTELYKQEIGIPFSCYIYPSADIEKRLKILRKAGLVYTCLALQSGSERINKYVFNRDFNKKYFLNTANLLKLMNINFYTDIITFTPAEDEMDLRATLDVVNELPRPFGLCVNKLYILQGTKIDEAIKKYMNGKDSFLLPKKTYLYYSRLFWLATRYNKSVVKAVEKIKIFKYFPFLFIFLTYLYIIIKFFKNPKYAFNKLLLPGKDIFKKK